VFAGSPSSVDFPDPPTPAAASDAPDLTDTMIALLERTQEADRIRVQRFCIKLLHCIELVAAQVAAAQDGSHITTNRLIKVWRTVHDTEAQRTDPVTGEIWQRTPTTIFSLAAEAAAIHLTLDCPSAQVSHVVKALHGKLLRSVRLGSSTTERIILPYPGITAARLTALCFPAEV